MKFALVSTLDDKFGNWVRLFPTEEAARVYAVSWLLEHCPERYTDCECLEDFYDFLGGTEWFHIWPVS